MNDNLNRPSPARDVGGVVLLAGFVLASVASLAPEADPDEGFVHCKRDDGVSCTAIKVGDSSDPEGERKVFEESCRCQGAGEGCTDPDGDFAGTTSDGRCPTEGEVARCTDASWYLEKTGERVDFEAVFYQPVCEEQGEQWEVALENTCAQVEGTLEISDPC